MYRAHLLILVRRIPFALVLPLFLLSTGCQSLGTHMEHADLPPGAPSATDILRDLRANDAALLNFRAGGTITVESPKLDSIQRFPSGTVAYRRPGDLYVVGRTRLNVIAFDLKCTGNEFLIRFPTVSDPEQRYYYRLGGEQFDSVPFSVSPDDIAREMFLPVVWQDLRERDARVVAYDEAEGTATLQLPAGHGMTRRLEVRGAPWVILDSILTDEGGEIVAHTIRGDYAEKDGVRFPAYVDTSFPGENTRLTFEMRNIRINTELPSSLFRIDWRPSR